MKYLSYIFLYLSIVIAASCSKEAEGVSNVPEGMTEVRFSIPKMYSDGSKMQQTKADSEFLADKSISKLPIGSTIWLNYTRKTEEGDERVVKPYVVKSSSDYVGLYPCGMEEYTDEKGITWLRANEEENGSPLYLNIGDTYNFKTLYPAYDIKKDDLSVSVYNGLWICTNDPRYTQTTSLDITLNSSDQKITYIDLHPMINQTARLHFEIAKGDFVHTLEMMQSGIEISGVQDKNEAHELDWTYDEYIKIFQLESIDDGKHWYKLQNFEMRDDKIIGDAYILPLDVRRTYIYILINMAVNGIPTQYVLTLNGIVLEHSRSYNFDLRAGIDGNLSVVNWQNTSFTVVAKPN